MGEQAGAPAVLHQPVRVRVADLVPHPRNYRRHPEDQLAHLVRSIQENGFYRNVVVASDGRTVLAGHGAVEAARLAGLEEVTATRLDVAADSPRALKVLAGDNEVSNLAEDDERALTNMLKEVSEADVGGLLGTGFDEAQLAALAFNTRPVSEVASLDEAAHWVGMPEFESPDRPYKVIVNAATEEDLLSFFRHLGAEKHHMRVQGKARSIRWPLAEKEDLSSLEFVPTEQGQEVPGG